MSKKRIALRIGALIFGLVIYLIGASIIGLGPHAPRYYEPIPLCIFTGIYIVVLMALLLRSQNAFRITALIAGLLVFWPIYFNYKNIWGKASYFELIITFATLMGIYLSTLFVVWIIFKIRHAYEP